MESPRPAQLSPQSLPAGSRGRDVPSGFPQAAAQTKRPPPGRSMRFREKHVLERQNGEITVFLSAFSFSSCPRMVLVAPLTEELHLLLRCTLRGGKAGECGRQGSVSPRQGSPGGTPGDACPLSQRRRDTVNILYLGSRCQATYQQGSAHLPGTVIREPAGSQGFSRPSLASSPLWLLAHLKG